MGLGTPIDDEVDYEADEAPATGGDDVGTEDKDTAEVKTEEKHSSVDGKDAEKIKAEERAKRFGTGDKGAPDRAKGNDKERGSGDKERKRRGRDDDDREERKRAGRDDDEREERKRGGRDDDDRKERKAVLAERRAQKL